jgi:hypothetical protein
MTDPKSFTANNSDGSKTDQRRQLQDRPTATAAKPDRRQLEIGPTTAQKRTDKKTN